MIGVASCPPRPPANQDAFLERDISRTTAHHRSFSGTFSQTAERERKLREGSVMVKKEKSNFSFLRREVETPHGREEFGSVSRSSNSLHRKAGAKVSCLLIRIQGSVCELQQMNGSLLFRYAQGSQTECEQGDIKVADCCRWLFKSDLL